MLSNQFSLESDKSHIQTFEGNVKINGILESVMWLGRVNFNAVPRGVWVTNPHPNTHPHYHMNISSGRKVVGEGAV
jgi:hypothetical protein